MDTTLTDLVVFAALGVCYIINDSYDDGKALFYDVLNANIVMLRAGQ